MKKVKQILILILTVVLLCGNTITVFATGNSSDSNSTQNSPSDEYASKEWKDQILSSFIVSGAFSIYDIALL